MPFGMSVILTLYPLTIGTAVANVSWASSSIWDYALRWDIGPGGYEYAYEAWGSSSKVASGLYLASAVFSALHFAFGPRDLVVMDQMMDEGRGERGKGEDNLAALGAWLGMNAWRGVLAEGPSLICALAAPVVAVT